MLKRLIILIVLSSIYLFSAELKQVQDFGKNPGHLRMYSYVPKTLDPSLSHPLVLVLHGSWQSAKSLSNCGGMNKLADSLQFIILYPDQPLYNNLLTAFAFYSPKKMKTGQGENASIRNMISYTLDNYSIDPDKIYIFGMSAGASMSNVMLNSYPNLFAAGALLAPPSQLHEGINPQRDNKPRIALIQGEKDRTVPSRHADIVQAQWEEFLELDAKDKIVENNYRGNPLLKLTHYQNDLDNYLVRLDMINAGHVLLVDPGDALNQGGKKCIYSKDIDFHLPYWVCEFFGLVKLP